MRLDRWAILIPLLSLVVGSVASVVSWRIADSQLEEAELARFNRYSERVVNTIRDRLMGQERLLEAGRGLFYASDEVSRDDWRTFVHSIDLSQYTGILGLGYIDHIPRQRLDEHLARIRRDVPDFEVKTSGDYPDLFVITQIEPFTRNAAARGLDIGKEEHRREAASQAAATGRTILTRRITLVQDQKKLAGFLLLMPIYQTKDTPAILDARWAKLQGWVYEPIRIDELMSGIVEATEGMVDFEVIEGQVDDPRAMLFDADGHLGNEFSSITREDFKHRRYHSVTQLSLYGREWRIHTSTLPEFDRTASSAFWVLPVGLLLTIMASILAWILIQGRGKAERLAEQMTLELRDQVRIADCLARVRLEQHLDLDMTGYCRRVVNHLQRAVRHPDATGVEIVLEDSRHASGHPIEHPLYVLSSRIKVGDREIGRISMLHLDASQDMLQAEQNMLDAVADTLGNWFERQQAADALAESEARFRSLYEFAPIGIALSAMDGQFILGNRALFDMVGHSEAEFHSLSYWDLTPEEYAAQEQEQLRSLLETGIYGPYEKEYLHKDGHRVPVLLHGCLISDSNGQQAILSTIMDITERKRMDRMKSEFVSTVSHELRTPLTAIRGALGLMAGGALGALPDPAKDLVDTAYRNSERLTVLINDLLDMEKIAAGQMHFDLQPQPLMPLVEQAIQANQAYAGQFQVRLQLAERLDMAQVNVDAQRFQQMLSNFLSNAVKFSPAGGEVTVRVGQADDQVRVTVTDQGPGIPDDFRDRIFQKFSQADASDTRAKGGTGLGLAITKELTEHMGGSVGFESTPGQGATFFVLVMMENGDRT